MITKLHDFINESFDIKYNFTDSQSDEWDYDLTLTDKDYNIIGIITFWISELYPNYLSVGDANIYDQNYKHKGIYQIALNKAKEFAKSIGLKGVVSEESSRNDIATKAWNKIDNKIDINDDYFLENNNSKETMTFWHGGNLDDNIDNLSHKSGRWEYGPGLYLVTQYDVVQKYAKGSRKLYKVTVEKGNDIHDANLDTEVIYNFVNKCVIKNKKKDIIEAINRVIDRMKSDKINAETFLNILINNNAIKNSDTSKLRQFFIDNSIDYMLVENAFGWGETMMVLFNMKKIISIERFNSKDRLDNYNFPTKFILETAPPLYDPNDKEHYDQLKRTGFFGAQAAGCVFKARKTGRILLVLRSGDVQEPYTWGNCGGAHKLNELPIKAAEREGREETGYEGKMTMKPSLIFKKDGFIYSNFIALVDDEFVPELGWEADDYVWCSIYDLPEPLHFGMQFLLKNPEIINNII